MLAELLTPEKPVRTLRHSVAHLAGLAFSAAALYTAPVFMPVGYSWLRHTTSESAAQGLENAWIARLGFLAFGLSVLWLADSARQSWARLAIWAQGVFGVCMVATAAFSHQPWLPGVAFDGFEDVLHSLTATVMGIAFALGVVVRLAERRGRLVRGQILDWLAILAATFLPILMANLPEIAGLAQRVMFGVAYAWYAREIWILKCIER